MPVADHPLWREWLEAEKTLAEAREQLRTVEHLDLGDAAFKDAWQTCSQSVPSTAYAISSDQLAGAA
jgi:hypothetical protein